MTPPPQTFYVAPGKLHPDKDNRPDGSGDKDLPGLAETIRYLGILFPLWVKPHPMKPGHFLIRDGHRRYKAGQMADLDQFPCTLRRLSNVERMFGPVLAEVVANTQRAPWSAVEFARKLGQLRDSGLPVNDIAKFIGLKPPTVYHHLRLLDLDGKTLGDVESGKLTVGAAHEAVKAARASAPAARPGPREVKPRRKPATPQRTPDPYFTATHPLAAAAAELCARRKHPAWQRLNRTACGTCWEDEIRADQDEKTAPQDEQAPPVTFVPAAPMAAFRSAATW